MCKKIIRLMMLMMAMLCHLALFAQINAVPSGMHRQGDTVTRSAPDVSVGSIAWHYDSTGVILEFNYINNGNTALQAPYPITLFADSYGGDTICTIVATNNLPVNIRAFGQISWSKEFLCSLGCDSIVLVVNCAGGGIAQNGNLQGESDTTNNTIGIAVLWHKDTTVMDTIACDSLTWINGVTYYQSTDVPICTLTNSVGCDSVLTLHITIIPSFGLSVQASAESVCEGDTVILQAVVTIPESEPGIVPVAVGDILCTDSTIVKLSEWAGSGKTPKGVVFYVDNSGQHGWAVNLQESTNLQWSSYSAHTPVMQNYFYARVAIADFNGRANTQTIRNTGSAADFPAAYSVDFTHNWYMPAIGQLRILYTTYNIVNASLSTVGGTPILLGLQQPSYWSSTQWYTSGAWQLQHGGDVVNCSKSISGKVRSVIDF